MLCCCLLEILNNFVKGALHFHFALCHANYAACFHNSWWCQYLLTWSWPLSSLTFPPPMMVSSTLSEWLIHAVISCTFFIIDVTPSLSQLQAFYSLITMSTLCSLFPLLSRLQMELLFIFPSIIFSHFLTSFPSWNSLNHHYNHCSIHLLIICLDHVKVLLKLSVYSPSAWPMCLNWLEKTTQSLFHFKIMIMDLNWALHAAQSLHVSCLCLCLVLRIHSGFCSGRWLFHTCFVSPDLQHLHFLALSWT